ncbi:MAG: hypothetical protein N2572_06650 [Syntrophales bacterium]|nr:hypothetical protein [Syntrophales bacterium]
MKEESARRFYYARSKIAIVSLKDYLSIFYAIFCVAQYAFNLRVFP